MKNFECSKRLIALCDKDRNRGFEGWGGEVRWRGWEEAANIKSEEFIYLLYAENILHLDGVQEKKFIYFEKFKIHRLNGLLFSK